jgi:hypothetical protein
MADASQSQRVIRAVIDKITAEWADQGKVIEGGWMAFVATALQHAPEDQLREMRKAYFLGAQHLYASVMSFMDTERDPTEQDIRRMALLHEELETFRRSLVN